MKTTNKRKHRNQMSPSEINAIEHLVHTQKKWTIGTHARKRLTTKGIYMNEALDVLKNGYVIEINKNDDLCAAFRKEYTEYAICVVVSLGTRWMVTVWKNDNKDIHETLDINKYRWDVDVTSLIEQYIEAA